MSRVGGTAFLTRSIDATEYTTRIMRDLGKVKPGEEILIVADSYTEQEVWTAFANAAAILGAKWTVAFCGPWTDRMIEAGVVNKLTAPIWKAYEGADVVVLTTLTWYARPYPKGAQKRLDAGKLRRLGGVCRSLRMLTGGGIDGLLDEDVREEIITRGGKMEELLKSGKRIRISDKLGTDLTSSLEDISRIEVLPDSKLGKEPIQSVFLPDGEVMWRPPNRTTEGVVVTDGPIAFVRESHGLYGNYPWESLKLTIKEGKIVKVEGGGDADRIRWINKHVKGSEVIDEVAVGLNPLCRETGEIMEEKKKLANAHIAFGALATFWHSDINIRRPKVEIDDQIIFEDGKTFI